MNRDIFINQFSAQCIIPIKELTSRSVELFILLLFVTRDGALFEYWYSNNSKSDMHFMYGSTNGTAREAIGLYKKQFPNIQSDTISTVALQLIESGLFPVQTHHSGQVRNTRKRNGMETSEWPERSTRILT
ncbi:hypothetical protein TNCT_187891 [Trichonephila clavata]|uniref:DUF4817 domain-containing protein n=1 Tax=Trichonephila clavata TaxID=2740835 RepID=A0A8X6GMJ0_TRICU|nr:hypothetical protein TNCT_187891 [Trichonephila clavata]